VAFSIWTPTLPPASPSLWVSGEGAFVCRPGRAGKRRDFNLLPRWICLSHRRAGAGHGRLQANRDGTCASAERVSGRILQRAGFEIRRATRTRIRIRSSTAPPTDLGARGDIDHRPLSHCGRRQHGDDMAQKPGCACRRSLGGLLIPTSPATVRQAAKFPHRGPQIPVTIENSAGDAGTGVAGQPRGAPGGDVNGANQ